MKETFAIHLDVLDALPVSVNKLYSVFNGRKNLTKAGKKYQDFVVAKLVRLIDEVYGPDWMKAQDLVYREGGYVVAEYTLVGNHLNKSWKHGGSSTKKGSPRLPYQKKDVTNYVKLIEDAVTRAVGIDDAAVLTVTLRKEQSLEESGMRVTYYVYPPVSAEHRAASRITHGYH